MSAQVKHQTPSTLTDGLSRNTFFNAIGLGWPILLALFSTPYIVQGLTYESYGLFGIVTLVAGYAGIFSSPMAAGSIRFMAQAYAREEWSEFKNAAVAGVLLGGGLAVVGAVIIFLTANTLADLFNVRTGMIPQVVVAFQLAAFAFFFNGVANALQGIPAAIRRYDILNWGRMGTITIRVFSIILAIWLGYGLVGVIAAQLLTSVLSLLLFILIVRFYLNQLTA
ncbi:MAG: MATE family efflux transporter, partial [Chloroflexota bacterium]